MGAKGSGLTGYKNTAHQPRAADSSANFPLIFGYFSF